MLKLLVKVLVFLLILVIILKAFVIDALKIPSGSMKDTLLVGDFVLVNKLAYALSTPAQIPFLGNKLERHTLFSIGKPSRNDVIAFEMPAEFYNPSTEKYSMMVKRVIGLPGDTLEIKNKDVFINGKKLRNPSYLHINLNEVAIENIGTKLFPYDKKWTIDNYGPVIIPAKDMTVELNPKNIELWQNAINIDLGRKVVSVEGTVITVNGTPIHQYTFQKNFYFVLGDNRSNSLDSRYFGYIPEEWIIGKPFVIYWSQLPSQRSGISDFFSNVRYSRLMKSIN